jgi:transcriptional regulator with XRE-family HTH domain
MVNIMLDFITVKDVKVRLGEACKQLRKASNLSQEELAEALSISRTTIQNIENGKNANLDNILKVANHFNLLPAVVREIHKVKISNSDISLY